MEVNYKEKETENLPVISICTFYEYLRLNCEKSDVYKLLNPSKKVDRMILSSKVCDLDDCANNQAFMNKTTGDLFEFEKRCNFLNDKYLVYVHNITEIHATNVTSYLNLGLFCKLYQFNVDKNYKDGFFKISSTNKHRFTVFMHEQGTYPVDVNSKIYFSEFKNMNETILILVELNKMITSSSLFVSNKSGSVKACFQDCLKKKNISRYNFLYLNDGADYTISDYGRKGRFNETEQDFEAECKGKCDFDEHLPSYFKLDKITNNCNSIASLLNKSMHYQPLVIFYQSDRVVMFNFNPIIQLKYFLIFLCNSISLIFGLSVLSFFSFITDLEHSVSDRIKFTFKEVNFKYSMIILSMVLSFIQSKEIIEEYLRFQTTTDLVMNMVQTIPDISVSLCFTDLLEKLAPNYDLRNNEFTSNYGANNNFSTPYELSNRTIERHLANLSVQEIIDMVDKISIERLLTLKILVSNRIKFVNTRKENTNVFIRNGRYCFRVDLQMQPYVTKSDNRIKDLIESEIYLIMKLKENFEYFFLTNYDTYPSYEDSAYVYENTFRILSETQSGNKLHS